ncbi:sugar transferase [Streptococcus loxodontisalivarius]|uniref:Exopolysaccharide biosynthesis polyprenyl glycosylphosphotransferase n=1 Tax=Streptococcus loxodontisalivarius TaxID=1349415 RepID=A0ABS2PP16_9STRE|nr:sugar transferase [Streptococcus loxodontisalivarius]MBM7641769.1 exopolysaccharide biosynthesis polyprenyl glycosylphosphotransferase [Streptococcus loxodontisalivarius]
MYSNQSSRKLFFLLSDILSSLILFIFLPFIAPNYDTTNFLLICLVTLLTSVAVVWTNGYSTIETMSIRTRIKGAAKFAVIYAIILLAVEFFAKPFGLSMMHKLESTELIKMILFLAIVVFLLRTITRYATGYFFTYQKNVLVVTNFSEDVQGLTTRLKASSMNVIGFFSSKEVDVQATTPILNSFEEVRYLLSHTEVNEIFVTADAIEDYFDERDYFVMMGVPVSVAMNSGEGNDVFFKSNFIQDLGDYTVLTSSLNASNYRNLFIKRAIDIVAALFGLLLTGLVALCIYPIVQKQSKGPLMFKQKRVGKNGKVFDIYKFRSMYLDAEERKKELMAQNELTSDHMFKMENDPRIFPFGQKIRDWSIDELPQFINVLKGDMSLVGTRPPTLDEYHKYELHHFKRLAMKPGITGMWQVSGRSNITDFEQVVSLDMSYIQNWSVWLDMKIILKTFAVVLKRDGSK